jgi:hypothetical protein
LNYDRREGWPPSGVWRAASSAALAQALMWTGSCTSDALQYGLLVVLAFTPPPPQRAKGIRLLARCAFGTVSGA